MTLEVFSNLNNSISAARSLPGQQAGGVASASPCPQLLISDPLCRQHHPSLSLPLLPVLQTPVRQRRCRAETAQLIACMRQRNSNAVEAEASSPLLGLSVVTAEETVHPPPQGSLGDMMGGGQGDRATVTLPSLPHQPWAEQTSPEQWGIIVTIPRTQQGALTPLPDEG